MCTGEFILKMGAEDRVTSDLLSILSDDFRYVIELKMGCNAILCSSFQQIEYYK